MNDNVCCDVSKQFPSASTAPASPAGTAPSYSTTNSPKKKERSFGARGAPQDDSGNQFRRRRTHRTEGEILRGKGDRYDLEWPRGLHNAPAFPAGPRSGGIIVGIICDDVSGRSAHARAERQLERESRIAGKRLGTKDLRIDDRAIGTNGTGVSKREGWQFRVTYRKRRGASRRST
jgi:hypothetical protein